MLVFRRLTLCAACTIVASAVGAQVPSDSRNSWRDFSSQHPNVIVTTGLLAGAATLSLLDNHLAYETRKFRDWSGSGVQQVSHVTTSIGGVLPLALGGTLAAAGWATHRAFTRTLGTDVVKGVVTSGLVTALIKGGVGRARPREFPDDPDTYYPGRGFTNNNLASFPSGHTSAAFAGATVLAMELSKAHPTRSRWIKVGMYGAATAIGFSRMYENAHWASDVFVGAAVGVASGMHVVRQRNGTP